MPQLPAVVFHLSSAPPLPTLHEGTLPLLPRLQHHADTNEQVFCDDCSQRRCAISNVGFKSAVRVCNGMYDHGISHSAARALTTRVLQSAFRWRIRVAER
jgi:hypothetical protein